MELEVIITLMIGLGFVSIIALKMLKNYNVVELQKNQNNIITEQTQMLLKEKILSLETSNRNYKNKIKNIRQNYDIDYGDIDVDEDEDDIKLSSLAQTIYPKLPPSLAKLIDKEEFQNAIIKTVEKKPDIINTFIDKFIPPKKEENNNIKFSDSYL